MQLTRNIWGDLLSWLPKLIEKVSAMREKGVAACNEGVRVEATCKIRENTFSHQPPTRCSYGLECKEDVESENPHEEGSYIITIRGTIIVEEMRLVFLISALLGVCQFVRAENAWSWNNEDDFKPSGSLNQDEIEAAESSNSNSTVVEDIVDSILSSTRQGRNLDGFDDLYGDPSVQEVLQKGDDREARNIIKDKLCSLGLMQCDGEVIQGKRPYISPEDLVYAQPVDIKPIGRPIPSIPVKHPIRNNHYGPPRPVSIPGKFGPPASPNTPPRRGYGPPSKPLYSSQSGKPFINGPPIGSYYEESEGFLSKPPGPFFSQPIEPDNAFDYDQISSAHHSSSHHDKKPVEVVIKTPAGPSGSLQQHVHHHFHHASGNPNIKVPVQSLVAGADVLAAQDPLFKPTPGSFHHSNSVYNNYRQESNKFNPSLSLGGISGVYGGQTIASYGGLGSYSTKPVMENYSPQSFDSNSFGASVGLYGNSGLYKKELNINSPLQSNYLYAGNYKGAESARGENYDCVCVPYNQCPSHDIIGRKDDLYLAIDPRNLKSDIDALTEERVITDGNGTMTVVRVPKASAAEVTEKSVTKREVKDANSTKVEARQANYYGGNYGKPTVCGPRHVCCKRPLRPQIPTPGFGNLQQCGTRHSQGINGRIKNPVYVDGDSEFGEYPWQVAILKKDPKESVYVCGGTLIDDLHIVTAAHCVRSYSPYDLRVRLGEWDVNHDVEFYPYVERDVSAVEVHPEFYAGTLYNDLALLRMDKPVDLGKNLHISPACLPHPHEDYTGQRCWTTGWGKDAFGEFGKYQNILKEVDVPIMAFGQCQQRLQQTRLGYEFKLHPGFICAGGEEGKDACKGDGGGPMVCERGGTWRIVGVVSWGIGCGQPGVPGVYVNVAHYLDWIRQTTQRFK
ncbi:hypothetical protein PPYR_10165 [Photinus pyralis]|uniref:Phenoloxidase-activating factor 2 n=2 Tax=Photinus pyralis TaxID=7054 RepID=A0A5N4AFL3_PHOPY|nr:hypothetical protein PPYR_10165 [Photinus pyralis]